MARFNLNKSGERFNLSKNEGGGAPLNNLRIAMGWEPNEDPNGPNFDLDVSAFMIGSDFKIPDDGFFVFYGSDHTGTDAQGNVRPLSQDNAMFGAVDVKDENDESAAEGDDQEDMLLDLSKVDPRVQQIIVAVTICKYPNDEKRDRRTLALNFGMVSNCYVRLIDERTNEEVLRYDLANTFSNEDAVEFCRIYRLGREWEFESLGRGSQGSLPGLIEMYT